MLRKFLVKLLVMLIVVTSTEICATIDTLAQISPIEIRASLVKQTVILGEPIIVDYRVINRFAAPLVINLTKESRTQKTSEWFSVAVLDDKGYFVSSLPDYRQNEVGESLSGSLAIRLKSGDVRQGQIVFTQHIALTHPGHYRVQIKAAIPYRSGAMEQSEQAVALVAQLGAYEETETFSLTVLPPDNARLQQIAEDWKQRAMTRGNYVHKVTAYQALFSMPASVAFSAWKEVASSGNTYLLNQELQRLNTSAAAEIAAQVIKDQKQNDEAHQTARFSLYMMYTNRNKVNNPALTATVTRLMMETEGKLPEEPGSLANLTDK